MTLRGARILKKELQLENFGFESDDPMTLGVPQVINVDTALLLGNVLNFVHFSRQV